MKEELLFAIEAETGLEMRHNKDFITLADLIFKETRENISPTTLKRAWGYISDQNCRTSGMTLDLLSRFLGFDGFYDFNKNGGVNAKTLQKRNCPAICSHMVCVWRTIWR